MALVLVVEDDVLIAEMLGEYLEELNHHVAGPVGSVAAALELIPKHAIDCAILDVSLGREDSFPIADVLVDQKVPLAFATGYGNSALPPHLAECPVIRKPYLFDDIQSLLSKLGVD